MAYVVATNGPQNVGGIPVPQGPVGVADPKNQGGYRVGVGAYLNQCSAVQVGYTEYNANTNDSQTSPGGIAAAPGLYSLVSHPTPFNAATLALDANANYQVGFKLIDADYRGLIAYCCDYQINYLVGVRYGQLTQRFNANYLGNANNNPESVSTSVNFYGAGFRTGLEGERYGANNNLFFYGKTFVSLLGGENKATYTEDNATSNTFIVNTKWKAGRVVTIYDLEMGGGWQNDCKNIRVSAGYLFSFWYNTVPTNEWIQAVQANNYVNQSTNFHGITSFDGFVARAEFRY